MDSQHATQERFTGNNPPHISRLRDSDALWLRRGERLGELLLASKASVYVSAAALGLMGAMLIVLSFVGGHSGTESATLTASQALAP